VDEAEELIDEIKRKKGYIHAWQGFLAHEDIDFVKAHNQLYDLALLRESMLSMKVRELVLIGVLSAIGDELALRPHIRRAFELGAQKAEIIGAIETAMLPCGTLALVHGLKVLEEVLNDAGN